MRNFTKLEYLRSLLGLADEPGERMPQSCTEEW